MKILVGSLRFLIKNVFVYHRLALNYNKIIDNNNDSHGDGVLLALIIVLVWRL